MFAQDLPSTVCTESGGVAGAYTNVSAQCPSGGDLAAELVSSPRTMFAPEMPTIAVSIVCIYIIQITLVYSEVYTTRNYSVVFVVFIIVDVVVV